MTVTRINEFQAKNGHENELADLIGSVISSIQAAPGCLSCQFLRSRADEAKFAIVEVWASEEAHQQAASLIPPETLEKAMKILASPPKGEYYDSPAAG